MLYLIALMVGASVGLFVWSLCDIARHADEQMLAAQAAETIEQVEPAETWRKMIDALRADEKCNPLSGSYAECEGCAYRIVSGDDGLVSYGCAVADVCFIATSRSARETLDYRSEPSCEAINEARSM